MKVIHHSCISHFKLSFFLFVWSLLRTELSYRIKYPRRSQLDSFIKLPVLKCQKEEHDSMRKEKLWFASHTYKHWEFISFIICTFFAEVKGKDLRDIKFKVISNHFCEISVQPNIFKLCNCVWNSCIKSH